MELKNKILNSLKEVKSSEAYKNNFNEKNISLISERRKRNA